MESALVLEGPTVGKKWNGQIQRVAAKHVNIVDRVVDPVRPAPQPVLIRKVK